MIHLFRANASCKAVDVVLSRTFFATKRHKRRVSQKAQENICAFCVPVCAFCGLFSVVAGAVANVEFFQLRVSYFDRDLAVRAVALFVGR